MTLTMSDLGPLLRLTFQKPAEAAQALLGLRLSRQVLWLGVGIVTTLGVLLAALAQGPVTSVPLGTEGTLVLSPFAYATMLGSSLVIMVFALHFTGRALGGHGDLSGALTVVVWLEVVAMAVRLVQAVVFLVLPPLGTVVSLVGLGLLVWILLSFTRVLHGFAGMGRSALTLVLAMLGIGIGLSVILALIGVGAGQGV